MKSALRLLAVGLFAYAASCLAQAAPSTPATLQLPVLVRSWTGGPAGPVDAGKFSVQFDNAQPSKPLAVRTEGDDPLTIGVLVDRSQLSLTSWLTLPDAAATLADSLRPHDRLLMYVTDGCRLQHLGPDSAMDAGGLRARTGAAIKATEPVPGGEPCKGTLPLWSAIRFLAGQLGKAPGRHVLLVFSNGGPLMNTDFAGAQRAALIGNAVTLIGIRRYDNTLEDTDSSMATWGGLSGFAGRAKLMMSQNPEQNQRDEQYAQECLDSGGVLMTTSPRSLAKTMAEAIALLRGRYILDITRPASGAGSHAFKISDGRSKDLIFPGAATPPLEPDAGTK